MLSMLQIKPRYAKPIDDERRRRWANIKQHVVQYIAHASGLMYTAVN